MDNPNAFPTNDITPCHPGMTLRDWFAGQALAGLLAHPRCRDVFDEGLSECLAEEAYHIAGAMLAERTE